MKNTKNWYKNNNKGFTLVELLVVLGILVILLTIVLIAINPAKQFSETNDVRRKNDVLAILNAVQQYAIDHNGDLPSGIGSSARTLSSGDLDICDSIVTRYIATLPFDPEGGHFDDCNDYDTKYRIYKGDDNRLTVEAPNAQGDEDIKVTR